jgi:Zn-finger nucleic acid-binding protein
MKQINYAYSTGVIIDRCNRCDGVWLDKHDLERIQIFMQEEEEKFPELRKKLEPVVIEMRLRHQDMQERQFREASYTSFLAKLPGMKSLVKFFLRHFD